MKTLIVRFVREEQGQDLIEYALLATFLSIAAAVGAGLAGDSLDNWYTALSTEIDVAAGNVSGAFPN